jgi:hypothetical protein
MHVRSGIIVTVPPFDVGVQQLEDAGNIAAVEGLVLPPNELDVLLRHSPQSIAEAASPSARVA